jgi:hypothetical protein
MAKLFYTLEEAAAKLGKSPEQVNALVEQGKLREFRDHDDKLMFKVDEVELLTEGSGVDLELDLPPASDDSFELDLADSGAGSPPAQRPSDSPVGLSSLSSVGDSGGLDLGDQPLELDLDGEASKSAAPPAADEFTLELDLDGDGAPAPAAGGMSASMSAIVSSSGGTDDLTLELDLESSAAPAPDKDPLNLDLDDSLGGAASEPAGATEELTLDGSAGGAMDSRMDSAAGSSISDRVSLEGEGSGSGLLDLTSDSESSSIGAALMDEAFSSDEGAELPANASGIFGGEEGGESGAGVDAVGAAAGAAVAAAVSGRGARAPIFTSAPASMPEAYSGPWSGLGVGLMVPSALALAAAVTVVAMRLIGAPVELAQMYASDWMMWTGGLAGAVLVCGAIGFFVGKATE